MVTTRLLLVLGAVGTCHFSGANVVRNQHRLARQTSGSDVRTELRFIMAIDAVIQILTSQAEYRKLHHYLDENIMTDNYVVETNLSLWVMKYLNTDRYTYKVDASFGNGGPYPHEYHMIVRCAYFMMQAFLLTGIHETNITGYPPKKEFNDLLANVNWCDECAPVGLPDTTDRVEIAAVSAVALCAKLEDECTSPFLEAMRKPALSLPPSSVTEADWYRERAFIVLDNIADAIETCFF